MATTVVDPSDRMKRALANKRPRKIELVLQSAPRLTESAVVELATEVFRLNPMDAVMDFEAKSSEIMTLYTTQEIGETKLVQAKGILLSHKGPADCVFIR